MNIHVEFKRVIHPDRFVHMNLVRFICAMLNRIGSINRDVWAWDILFRGARHDIDKLLLADYGDGFAAAGMTDESKMLHDLYNDHHAAYWINHIRETDIPDAAFVEHLADSLAFSLEHDETTEAWVNRLSRPKTVASMVLTRDWSLYHDVFEIDKYFHERLSMVSTWYVSKLDKFRSLMEEAVKDINAMTGAVELLKEIGEGHCEVILTESESCPCCKEAADEE